ncbi:hypothetical protein [Micromonospora sp. NPDC023956]|uniref:hypothetical protein n=1 Tax=Micromonospora sp. NPDC023956 TaxID=3155722 RepID=UPI0033FAC4EA
MEDLPVEASHRRRPQRPLHRGPEGRRYRGKLTTLVALLRDHYDAVEADLRRFYGVDLADLWAGELSLRRLSAYVANLPAESATWAAEHGVAQGLTPTDLLLADIFHALAGEPHPIKPRTTEATSSAAKTRHEALAAKLRAQRARLAREAQQAQEGGAAA